MILPKPKIAILALHPSNGGGVLSVLKIVYDYASRFFEPTVFCLSFDPEISASVKDMQFFSQTRKSVHHGMNVVEIGARWAFWEPGHYAYTRHAWEKALEGYDYFFMTEGTIIGAHPLVLLNKKYVAWVATPHDDNREERIKGLGFVRRIIENFGHKKMLSIELEALKKCSYLFALSNYAAERFTQLRGDVSQPMVLCGYPIKAKNPLVSTTMRRSAGHLLAVGRFDDPRKNVSMLLRAFERIYEHHQDRLLVIVGKKPANFVLAPFALKPFFKNVFFTGYVSPQELERWYQQASVMLISSYQEGLGIVGLEALSYGIPVVSTRCGGPADFVIDKKTGFLVNNNDDQAMSFAVRNLLDNEELYTLCSAEALEFIKKNNDTEYIYSIFTQGLCSVYPELLPYLYENMHQEKTAVLVK